MHIHTHFWTASLSVFHVFILTAFLHYVPCRFIIWRCYWNHFWISTMHAIKLDHARVITEWRMEVWLPLLSWCWSTLSQSDCSNWVMREVKDSCPRPGWDGLHKRLFKRRSMKTSKRCVTGFCEGNSPVTGECPAQGASNAENVSIWLRHHIRRCSWLWNGLHCLSLGAFFYPSNHSKVAALEESC